MNITRRKVIDHFKRHRVVYVTTAAGIAGVAIGFYIAKRSTIHAIHLDAKTPREMYSWLGTELKLPLSADEVAAYNRVVDRVSKARAVGNTLIIVADEKDMATYNRIGKMVNAVIPTIAPITEDMVETGYFVKVAATPTDILS